MPELLLLALLGGVAVSDRQTGWGLQLGQPLVGACLAGAFINPGPEWELWALRIPLGVGVLLQLLLTDPALPAAQRARETSAAAPIGTAIALLAMERLHERLPLSGGGLLWVIVGTTAGLLAAAAGGLVLGRLRARNQLDLARVDSLASEGRDAGFEWLYWRAVLRVFLTGSAWTAGATLIGLAGTLALLPGTAWLLAGSRLGFVFAVLLGVALATAYHAHVRGRAQGGRWAALGGLAAAALLIAFRSAAR